MSYQTYYPAVFYDSSLNIPCNADGAPYYSDVSIPADLQDLPDLFLTYSPPKFRHFPTDSDTSSLPGPSTTTDGSSNVPLEVITTKRGKPMIIYEKNLFQERTQLKDKVSYRCSLYHSEGNHILPRYFDHW